MLRDFLLNQAKAFGAQHYRVRMTGDCVLSCLITEVIRGGFFDAHHYGSPRRYLMGDDYEYSEDYVSRLFRHDGPNDDEWRPFQEFWNGLELENSGIEPPGDDEYSWYEYGFCRLDLSDEWLTYNDRELLVSIAHPRLWTSGRPKGRLYMKIDSWVSLAEYETRQYHTTFRWGFRYDIELELRRCWGVIPRISNDGPP